MARMKAVARLGRRWCDSAPVKKKCARGRTCDGETDGVDDDGGASVDSMETMALVLSDRREKRRNTTRREGESR